MTSPSSEVNSLKDTTESRIDASNFRAMIESDFGITGETPEARVEHLKELSVEGVSIMLESINKAVLGVEDSQISHDKTIKIGNKSTISPEHRYEVFYKLIEGIKATDESINPARIADTLALGVVLLHPFNDGNGRTARTIGLIFRDNYDQSDFGDDFNQVSESRDKLREKGGWMMNGYIPKIEGDQSDPDTVNAYLTKLLTDEAKGAYVSCYGYDVSPLYGQASHNIIDDSKAMDDHEALESQYNLFAQDVDVLINDEPDSKFLGEGLRSKVYKLERDDGSYAVRLVKPKRAYDTVDAVVNDHVGSSLAGYGISGLERVVAVSHENGVIVSELVKGSHMSKVSAEVIDRITDNQLDELIAHRIEASKRGIRFDAISENILYDPENGFTDIDYALGGKEMDTFRVICSVFESLNLISQIELEDDTERKKQLSDQNLAIYRLIGTYCKSRFSVEFRDKLGDQFQIIRANMVAHAKTLKRI